MAMPLKFDHPAVQLPSPLSDDPLPSEDNGIPQQQLRQQQAAVSTTATTEMELEQQGAFDVSHDDDDGDDDVNQQRSLLAGLAIPGMTKAVSAAPKAAQTMATQRQVRLLRQRHQRVLADTGLRWLEHFSKQATCATLLFVQLVLALLLTGIAPHHYEHPHARRLGVLFLLLPATVLQWHVTHVMFSRLWDNLRITRRIGPWMLINVYMSVILVFSGTFWAFFVFSPSSFMVDDISIFDAAGYIIGARHTNHFEACFTFIYYTISTMTSTGFGDIKPVSWYAQILTDVDMLLATVCMMGVFAFGMRHISSPSSFSSAQPNSLSGGIQSPTWSLVRSSRVMTTVARECSHIMPKLSEYNDAVQSVVMQYLFLVTVAVQAVNLAILLIISDNAFKGSDKIRKMAVVCTLLQVINIAIIISMSLRLVQQIHEQSLTFNFLIQSYLSTVVGFSGVYVMLFLIQGDDAFKILYHDDGERKNKSLFVIITQLLHFSIATMTFTGMGDVFAIASMPRIFVSLEMLSSLLYTVVILGLGLARVVEKMEISDAAADRERLTMLSARQEQREHRPRVDESDVSGTVDDLTGSILDDVDDFDEYGRYNMIE